MRIYLLRDRLKENIGHLVSATPFKYIDASKVLSKKRKFGGVEKDEEELTITLLLWNTQ